MTYFVVIVASKEARSGAEGNPVMTTNGTKFIVLNEPEGLVEATSQRYDGNIPADAKLFRTRIAAEEFAKRWSGHPWWCIPNDVYQVLEVEEVVEVERRVTGYKEVS